LRRIRDFRRKGFQPGKRLEEPSINWGVWEFLEGIKRGRVGGPPQYVGTFPGNGLGVPPRKVHGGFFQRDFPQKRGRAL